MIESKGHGAPFMSGKHNDGYIHTNHSLLPKQTIFDLVVMQHPIIKTLNKCLKEGSVFLFCRQLQSNEFYSVHMVRRGIPAVNRYPPVVN